MYLYITLFLFSMINIASNAVDINKLPWDNECHDGDELTIIKPFLPDNPVILEAGACGGEDTVKFNQMWPQAIVHAFEPVPEFFERLKNSVENMPNIHIYNYGLYLQTGIYSFNLCQGQTPGGASSLFPSAGMPETAYDERPIQIMCKNLDEWAGQTGVDHVDYMWLDMEGAEYDVLKSAPKILSTVRVISCELNFRKFRIGMAQFETVYNFLISQGFILHKIWGSPTWQATGIFIRAS